MSDHHLLDIQRLDTEAEQLRHKHATLPQRAERDEALSEQTQIAKEIETVGLLRIEIANRQKRFEDEAQIFSAKADEDDKRLYSGDVGVKELQALQDEIAGLRVRQGDLEEHALEAMEEAETQVAQLGDAESRAEAVAEKIIVLEAEIAANETEIEQQLVDVASGLDAAAAAVEDSDLAEYEKLRPGMGSATVVRFNGKNCVGCPSTMPSMELDRMKHAEANSVLSCNECGRIVLT